MMKKSNLTEQSPAVDIKELLDTARNYTQSDTANSEYNINLALLAINTEDDYTLKIQTHAIRSFINFKTFNIFIVLLTTKKFLKEISKNIPDASTQDVSVCFFKGLYRISSLFSNSKFEDIFLSAYFYHKTKNYLESNLQLQNNQEFKNQIENNFISVLDQISIKLKNEKLKLKDQKYIQILKEINEYFDDLNSGRNSEDLQRENVVYIVSALWIRKLLNFINHVRRNETNEYLEKLFNRRNVCILFFNDGSNKEELKRYLGSYPGPINNYLITQTKDFWYNSDPDLIYTNNFLRRDIKENSDFIYLGPEIYQKIKLYFGINPMFEIERRKLENESIFEIHLHRIKVLVLSDLLLENGMKNYIRPRYIQVSKNDTVHHIKNKIVTCLYNLFSDENNKNLQIKNILNNFNNMQFQVKLFIPNKSSNQDMFQIILSYVNKFASFKIKGEEIKDDKILSENLKLAEKDVLIIEIKTTEDKRKNFFVNIINESNDNLEDIQTKCSLCNKICKINNITTIINCESCDQYIYCSNECKLSDENHLNFHKNMNQLLKKKFDIKDIISIDISELISKDSSHGLTGLKNLGNTCFMNSAVQCLSNIEELTKYFLLKKFMNEINKKTKYGSGGQIAKAYYELIREIWQGRNDYLSPWDFRKIFVEFVKQFAGFSQHDSHEMLAFMLDALHEDLNRVKDKPYQELKEKMNDESEEEASIRWWSSHLSRENSIITDLFHGQFKSVITCPDCHRISITYDPFMYLGLPIPSGHCKIRFKFFNLMNNLNIIEMNVEEQTTVKNVKAFIINSIYAINSNSSNSTRNMNLKLNNLQAIVTHNLNFRKIIKDDNLVINFYENNHEIVFYEVENLEENNYYTIYTQPIEFIEEKSIYGVKVKNPKPISYVKPFNFMMGMDFAVKDLYYEIFKNYRKIIPDMESRTYQSFVNNINDETYIYDEFVAYFSKQEVPFNLYIVNNIPQNAYDLTCEFCKKNCESFCKFGYNLDFNLENILAIQKLKRPFILYVEFVNTKNSNRQLYENMNQIFYKNIYSVNENVSIYDCLESFRSDEKLEKENSWYCSKCKTHQEANKKLEIYKAPNVLIVQFKRFKIKTNNVLMGMMHNKKNDNLIKFPIDDLDLRPYVVSEYEKEDALYELCGISQHFGTLSSGHYTALCRNRGNWFHFDDERVSRASEGSVVSPAAYLLFYRKKSMNTKNNK